MKDYPAIATIEFEQVSTGVFVTDAMIKKAPIAVVKTGTISHGRYLTLIGGTTASVDESFREGLLRGDAGVVDSVFLPDIHPLLHDGIFGARHAPGDGSLAILEADTVSGILRASEAALKGARVELVEIRLADSLLRGKGISILHGRLHDVEAAVEVAVLSVSARSQTLNYRVITAPHEVLSGEIAIGTRFGEGELRMLGDREEAR